MILGMSIPVLLVIIFIGAWVWNSAWFQGREPEPDPDEVVGINDDGNLLTRGYIDACRENGINPYSGGEQE